MVAFQRTSEATLGATEEQYLYMFGGILTLTEAKKKSTDVGTGY